jgi:toxin ParE1/3/4
MPAYRLSPRAAEDLRDILRFGIPRFGKVQAVKYHAELESRFALLTQFPRIGQPTYDLRPGLYRYGHKSHVIFYAIAPDAIVVQRILHASADFARHF